MRRIFITLDAQKLHAINALAQSEKRTLKAQIDILLDEILQRRGELLTDAPAQPAHHTDAAPRSGGKNVNAN